MGFFKRLKKLLGFTKLSEITRTLDKKLMEKNINDWTDEKKLFLDNIVNEIVYTKYSDQKIKNLLLERVKYWAKRLNKSRNLKEVEISILCSLVIGSQVEISVKISNKLLFMLTQSCCNDNFLAYDGSADLLPFVRVLYLLENEKLIDEQHKNFLIKSYLILLANSKSLTDFENGLESLKGAFYDETDTFIKNLNNKDKNEIKIKHKLDDLSKLKKRKTDVDNEIEIVEENEQNILDSRNQNEAEIVENEIVEVEFEEKNFEKNDLVHESEVIAKEKQDALRYKGSVKKRNTDKLVEITDKLFETIKYDDLEDRKIAQTIKILSEEGVNINRKGKFRLTILMVSAKKGYKRVLNILLDNKEIDLNLRDNCGRTALDYAEGKEIIELLMEKGASTGNCLEFGRTPLMSVIADYNYDNGYAIINKLLRKPKIAKEINRKDYNGSTALMLAVIKCKEDPRYEQIVANLLKKQTKIDVNLQDNNKFTALDYCKSKGIKVLLLTTKDAFTGEDLALERTSLMSVLLNYPNDESLYPLLESKGIQTNLNKQDKNGYTVLMFAVLRSYEKIVEKLLNIQGIMVNIKCVHGRTALDLARTERIKELLYMKGALTSTDLITERTTLMSAILNYNGDKNKIVKALLNLPSTRLKLNKQDSQRNTALMYAVEINDEEIVAMLLKIEKINVNLQNIVGFTALNYAKNKTIEALLLEKGASARGDVESKKTKLMSAISEIENKDKIDKIAKELLKSEDVVDSINYQDESGDTALTYAVRANYKKVVEMILKQKNVDVNKINDLGFTPLDYSKSPEMIEVLLENGALKNEDLKRQRTPLMSLISNYKYSYKYSGVNENNIIGMVKNLLNLEHVAKTLNEKNKSGATALDYAENENIEIQKILLEKGARKGRYLEETDKTALMCAILDCGYKRDISGMYEIIEYLLGLENVKKTINNKDKNGYTALMLAAIGGYTKIVKMILKCENINVNEENAKGDTALVLAVRRNWEKTVKVLLEHKDINVNLENSKSEYKSTPLDYARSKEIKILLLEKGGHKKLVSGSKEPGIMSIISDYEGEKDKDEMNEIIERLAKSEDFKSKLNERNKYGLTPLMLVVKMGDIKAIEMLSKANGIEINLQNDKDDNKTALDYANRLKRSISYRGQTIRKLLRKRFALTNEDLKFQMTALMSVILHYSDDDLDEIISEFLKSEEKSNLNKQNKNGYTALMFALIKINKKNAMQEIYKKIVEMLLKCEGIELNLQNIDGNTAMDFATMQEIKRSLLLKGAFTGKDLKLKNTHLMSAIWNYNYEDRYETVNELSKLNLINIEKDVNEQNENGDTALIYALLKDDIKIVEMLLERKNINVNLENKNGYRPLDCSKNKTIKRLLLIKGAFTKEDLELERTHLMSIIFNYDYSDVNEIVENLLESENTVKDLNKKSKNGYTALDYAMYAKNRGNETTKRLLSVKGALTREDLTHNRTTLISAIVNSGYECSGIYETVSELLKLESVQKDLNKQDNNGYTALMHAAKKGGIKIVEILLKLEKINVNLENKGQTALDCVAFNPKIIKKLLFRSGAVKGEDLKYERTTIMSVILNEYQDSPEILNELLKLENIKKQLNVQDKDGNTALILAIKKNNRYISALDEEETNYQKIIEMLLKLEEIDVNIQDNDGKTALMIASERNYTAVMKLLENKDINVNLKDKAGKTALSYCSREEIFKAISAKLKK